VNKGSVKERSSKVKILIKDFLRRDGRMCSAAGIAESLGSELTALGYGLVNLPSLLRALLAKKEVVVTRWGPHVYYSYPQEKPMTEEDTSLVRNAKIRAMVVAFLASNPDKEYEGKFIADQLQPQLEALGYNPANLRFMLVNMADNDLITRLRKGRLNVFKHGSTKAEKPSKAETDAKIGAVRQLVVDFLNGNPNRAYTAISIGNALANQLASIGYSAHGLRYLLKNLEKDKLIQAVSVDNPRSYSTLIRELPEPIKAVINHPQQPVEKSPITGAPTLKVDIVKSSGKVRLELQGLVIEIGVIN